MEQGIIYILISPLIIGGIIAAINADVVNKATEMVETWIRITQANVSIKKGWFYRFTINPLLWVIVKFNIWTDSFAHRGLKNGIRIAMIFYLLAVWSLIIYAAFITTLMLLIAVVLTYIVFKILSNSNKTNFQNFNSKNEMNLVGFKGCKTYSGTNWFNEKLKGRVDENGNIYSGTNWLNEEKIGRIDDDGNIYKGTNWMNEEKVGRIDDDGKIHKGTNWFNEKNVGRIDKDGNVLKGTNWFNEKKTGRTGL